MNITYKIQTKKLDLFYGEFQALSDINMNIETNKITALIGPSGCGKSTFLRTLNRMNDLIASVRITGNVFYDNTDIYNGYDVIELRKRIGMVFQKPNPFPMSVYDNVAYGPRVHGIRKKELLDEIVEKSIKAAALWDEVADRLQRPALGLSGGQQQRLCIARSLALEPEVLLLDEPTSGLDPISTGKVEASLYELKQHYTIIIVPHSIQQAARVADQAAFFLMGEMVEYSPGKEIFTTPKDGRTEDYVTGRFG